MKKTDLYKNLALKTSSLMKQAVTPDRFASGTVLDRKERRKLDQAKGLISFAVKLDAQLAADVRAHAENRQVTVDEAVAALLRQALAGAG